MLLHLHLLDACFSYNRLELSKDPSELAEAFKFIKELYANKMDYDWSQVQ